MTCNNWDSIRVFSFRLNVLMMKCSFGWDRVRRALKLKIVLWDTGTELGTSSLRAAWDSFICAWELEKVRHNPFPSTLIFLLYGSTLNNIDSRICLLFKQWHMLSNYAQGDIELNVDCLINSEYTFHKMAINTCFSDFANLASMMFPKYLLLLKIHDVNIFLRSQSRKRFS